MSTLKTYAPPKELQSMRIWTLGCGDDGKAAECFYKTGRLKKSLEKQKVPQKEIAQQIEAAKQMLIGTWPATLRRYMQNPSAYPAESVGFISQDVFTIDVDVKKEQPKEVQEEILQDLPKFLKDFVDTHPTFYHRSKSGKGWKVYYRINEPVQKKITAFKRDGIQYGELFYNKFVTSVDPDRSDFGNESIANITLASLVELFPELATVERSNAELINVHTVRDYKVMMEEVDKLLSIIPPVVDVMVETAYEKKLKGSQCDPYSHWLNVGFGLAALAAELSTEYPSAVIDLQVKWIQWSQLDEERFDSVEACEEKFQELYDSTVRAMNNHEYYFSYESLRKLMHGFRMPLNEFNALIKAKNNKYIVDPTDPENFAQLTKWLELDILEDENGNTFITGPVPMVKHFLGQGTKTKLMEAQENLSTPYKTEYGQDMKLKTRLVSLARAYGISKAGPSSPLFHGLDKLKKRSADLVLGWILSKPWDKVERVRPLIESTIEIDEAYIPEGIDKDFFYHLIHKHLIITAGMREKALRIRLEESTAEDILRKPQAMLIFRGGQNCGKSTWIESLLPLEICSYNEASYKTIESTLEFKRAVKGLTILSINEVEAIFDNFDLSELKNILSQNSDMFRTMHTQAIESNPRTAGIFGTTNQTSLKLDRTGNRRFWIVPVKNCDAMPLLNGNAQQFWAELVETAINTPIDKWNLCPEERDKINIIAKQFSRSTSTAKSIEAVFTDQTGIKKYYTYRTFDFEALFNNMTQKRFRELTNVVLFAKSNKAAFSIVENLSIMRNLTVSEGAFEHDIENWISHTVGKPNESTVYGSRMIFKEGVIKIWANGRKNDPIEYHLIPLKEEFDKLRLKNIKGSKEKVLPNDYFLGDADEDTEPILTAPEETDDLNEFD